MSRVSKRVRDGAAEMCSMAASEINDAAMTDVWTIARDYYGANYDVPKLACKALNEAARRMPTCHGLALWAEAECLLRTGWTP